MKDINGWLENDAGRPEAKSTPLGRQHNDTLYEPLGLAFKLTGEPGTT